MTPEERTNTKADNAAASSRKAANQPQRGPTPQAVGTVVLEITGSGTAGTIDLYDPAAAPRQYNVRAPVSHTVRVTPKSGELYQIVGAGKGNDALGCRISVNGNVVAEQPIGGSGQCVYVAP